MNKGYIKLYRKALDSGLIRNHNAWILFTYCLLKAAHKKHKTVIGKQEIILKPGQLIFGRRMTAKETGLTEQQIRTALAILQNLEILSIRATNKFSIITIINWSSYQAQETEDNQPLTSKFANFNQQINQQNFNDSSCKISKLQNENPFKQPANQPAKSQKSTTYKNDIYKKTPPDFFELKKRYPDPSLIEKCFAAIDSTRKRGKVADSVKLACLQKWEKYPIEQVEAGIKTYLEKDYAGQGKGEKYLHGIIRNQNGSTGHSQQPEAPRPKFYSANNPEDIEELLSNG